MTASLEELEERLSQLRARLREARRARDAAAASRIRSELREAEAAWEDALDAEEATEAAAGEQQAPPPPPAPRATRAAAPPSQPVPRGKRSAHAAVPVREQVHQSLTLLGAPAAPKLISSVYEAFFSEPLVATKLASLRRDEERSFNAQGYARPYYICAALTHDRLTPARGLLAVSVWPLQRRVIGPLSLRVDFLTHAVGTAEQIQRLTAAGHPPSDAAWQLLRRFALNIPGAYDNDDLDPARVISAARTETAVHQEADDAERGAAADRACAQLTESQQLFGAAPLHNALRDARGAGL
ncbi:hypothetical protein [Streptomyces lomondensis]|uniref:Uncharacterized protein n=1 Tax=Streptomyces lomondensis TaxID=68229 RepID=A0ABQ2X2B7_9ACTN|nr:hypothetical protein [Streptomyces lomondensis]MCF0082203.1 hypothetical protein [Streptomyces lomondensis]GGW94184.1 hypothetical protein GCM10010383_24680 [Streptomyces lomondensis]